VIIGATANMTQTFMKKTQHDAPVQRQPIEAIAVHWKEMIQRVHVESCSALFAMSNGSTAWQSPQKGDVFLDFLHHSEDFLNRQSIQLTLFLQLQALQAGRLVRRRGRQGIRSRGSFLTAPLPINLPGIQEQAMRESGTRHAARALCAPLDH
jgi:hypothetical protein